VEGKKYIPKNFFSQTFAHPKLGADPKCLRRAGEGAVRPMPSAPRWMRKLQLKSYLMRSVFLVRQLTHCLPAGGRMVLAKICRVSLRPQLPSFRLELPATGAERADVRVHPQTRGAESGGLHWGGSCFSGTPLSVPQTDLTRAGWARRRPDGRG